MLLWSSSKLCMTCSISRNTKTSLTPVLFVQQFLLSYFYSSKLPKILIIIKRRHPCRRQKLNRHIRSPGLWPRHQGIYLSAPFPGLCAEFPARPPFPWGGGSPFHLPAPGLATELLPCQSCLSCSENGRAFGATWLVIKPSFRDAFVAFDRNSS